MNTTTIFKLTNGQTLEYVSQQLINSNTIEITLHKPKKGPYVKKAPEDMKPRGRPVGSKSKKAPHIIDHKFRDAVAKLPQDKQEKVMSLFSEVGLDYAIDQALPHPNYPADKPKSITQINRLIEQSPEALMAAEDAKIIAKAL